MANLENDIEAFAALCAKIADPSTLRERALAEAGLPGERAFSSLCARWSARLDPALRERYQIAYARARSALHDGPPRRVVIGSSGVDELGATCETRTQRGDPSLDDTAELGHPPAIARR